MGQLKYKFIKEGDLKGHYFPLSMSFIDYADVLAAGLTMREACELVAKECEGPMAINMFDMTAATTNSDGIMLDGAMTCMAASDYGKINKEFGYLEMKEIEYSEEYIAAEPHLMQWKKNYPDRRLLMGPDPDKKNIPIHNATLTGRAGNNNSATEIMHYINMEEFLLLVSGQIQVMKGKTIELGGTGHIISVAIGMVVGEQYGRIVPRRQFRAGKSGHQSGKYSKFLKAHIPCLAADRKLYAEYIVNALNAGVIPGLHVGASPAILAVARHKGIKPAFDNMEPMVFEELADVGFTREWMEEEVELLSDEEIIARADEIIPGLDNPVKYDVSEIVEIRTVEF